MCFPKVGRNSILYGCKLIVQDEIMINFSVHDDHIFVLIIITSIKMVNVGALSSQNVNCSLSSSHTLVDLYLFMWRETVDFKVD